MSAIVRNEQTGEMVRSRAIHGSKEKRDHWHQAYEARMDVVARDCAKFVAMLKAWMPIVTEQTVITVVGCYAHDRGLSFNEALDTLYRMKDSYFISVCRQFGVRKAA
jgi:hypothetical protein